MNKVILLLFALVCCSCAHVPMASVQLSEALTEMIVSAEQSHMALIEQYIDDRRQQVETFLLTTGIPEFMGTMIDSTNVINDFEAASTPQEKAIVMTDFSSVALDTIADWRNSMLQTLDEVEDLLKAKVHDHYMNMLTVNTALTAHLRSAAKVTETRKKLLGALRVDPEKLIPFDKINGVLEKVITAESKIEDIGSRVNEVRKILNDSNTGENANE